MLETTSHTHTAVDWPWVLVNWSPPHALHNARHSHNTAVPLRLCVDNNGRCLLCALAQALQLGSTLVLLLGGDGAWLVTS